METPLLATDHHLRSISYTVGSPIIQSFFVDSINHDYVLLEAYLDQ